MNPILSNLEFKEVEKTRTSNSFPEFHIGMFKDLGSADGSVREADADRLVMELQAVQKAYNMLEKKEDVDGGLKLEAEKDDGLNNCAPSLRYAVRRLVRGVSSSREVCVLPQFDFTYMTIVVFTSRCLFGYSFSVCKTRVCIGLDYVSWCSF